jgi:hypothetical protein
MVVDRPHKSIACLLEGRVTIDLLITLNWVAPWQKIALARVREVTLLIVVQHKPI